jgi:hypothetical protein
MKMKMKSKLATTALIAALSGAAVTANAENENNDGIMELPVFYVYASDSEVTDSTMTTVQTDWKFEKSLDFQADPIYIVVEGPGDETYKVRTPGIRTSLLNGEIENS